MLVLVLLVLVLALVLVGVGVSTQDKCSTGGPAVTGRFFAVMRLCQCRLLEKPSVGVGVGVGCWL